MEHIVQFGINIDDEAIKRTIMESGVKTSRLYRRRYSVHHAGRI